MFPVEHFAHCFLKCAKKAVLAPIAPLYATSPFCWAVFHKCSTKSCFMFHNDYQPINKNRLRNEIPWNTMFHAPFSDVPRNVPRTLCAIKWSSLFPVSWYLYYIMFTRAKNIVETCHWRVFRLPTWVFSRRRNATSLHGLSPIIDYQTIKEIQRRAGWKPSETAAQGKAKPTPCLIPQIQL